MPKPREEHFVTQRRISLRYDVAKVLTKRPSFRKLRSSANTAKAHAIKEDIRKWTTDLIRAGTVRTTTTDTPSPTGNTRNSYHKTANSDFYTDAALQHRMELREAPRIRQNLAALWAVLPKDATRRKVSRRTYFEVFRCIALEVFKQNVTDEQLRQDWVYDTGSNPKRIAKHMTKQSFLDAAFDLIDTWTDTTEEGVYAELAWRCATQVHSIYRHMWKRSVPPRGDADPDIVKWTPLTLTQIDAISSVELNAVPIVNVVFAKLGTVEVDVQGCVWVTTDCDADGRIQIATDPSFAPTPRPVSIPPETPKIAKPEQIRSPCNIIALRKAGIAEAKHRYLDRQVLQTGLLPLHFDEGIVEEGDGGEAEGGWELPTAAAASTLAISAAPSSPRGLSVTPGSCSGVEVGSPGHAGGVRCGGGRWVGQDPLCLSRQKRPSLQESYRKRVHAFPSELRRTCRKLHSESWGSMRWGERLKVLQKYEQIFASEHAKRNAPEISQDLVVPPLGEIHPRFSSVAVFPSVPPPLVHTWPQVDVQEGTPEVEASSTSFASAKQVEQIRPSSIRGRRVSTRQVGSPKGVLQAQIQYGVQVCGRLEADLARDMTGIFRYFELVPEGIEILRAAVTAAVVVVVRCAALAARRLPPEVHSSVSVYRRAAIIKPSKRTLLTRVADDTEVVPYWQVMGKPPPVAPDLSQVLFIFFFFIPTKLALKGK